MLEEKNKDRRLAKIEKWQEKGPKTKTVLGSRVRSLKEQVGALEEVSETDSLTGLMNRRGFEARARLAYENLGNLQRGEDPSKRSIVLTILDVDKFKSINDTHGHNAGDEVLRAISRYLRENVRVGDIVGRWGGEEFVLALVNGPKMPVAKIADKLRQGIEGLDIQWKGERIIVTASFGVADGSHDDTFDEAIAAADKALYAAKHGGRNRVETSSSLEKVAA